MYADLAPRLAPRVADDPVVLALLGAEADERDAVVHLLGVGAAQRRVQEM